MIARAEDDGHSMLPYRTFLAKVAEDLQMGIETAEDAGWHHAERGTEVATYYALLVTWEHEVSERLRRYDTAKTSKTVR